MPISPASHSFAPEASFRYVGGDPSLDLVNTVDWTSDGLANDRLVDYRALTRWGEGAGLLTGNEARTLRRAARQRPREAEATYEAARYARWVLARLFASLSAGRVEPRALEDFNHLLAESLRRLAVGTGPGSVGPGAALAWSLRAPGDALEGPLWRVAWAAAGLLTSADAARVRRCSGRDCGWLFVDRSRNGLRRWCDMATCGTSAKSRRRAARRRA